MSSQALLNLLIKTSEKAWRKGGGGGASSGLGGRGKGPGSRGGKFWINASGHVEYGPKPSGARGKGGSSKAPPKVTAITSSSRRAGITAADVRRARGQQSRTGHSSGSASNSKLQAKRRMLTEMNRVLQTGKDPHGNKLSSASLSQLRGLAAGLSNEIRSGKEVTVKAKAPTKGDAKIAKVMGEFKKGALNTGNPKGPKVTNPKQAIAIALSQARKVSKKATIPLMPLAQPDPTRPPDIQQVHTGVMVALRVPSGIAEAIAMPGGEPIEDLHLTLAYLGDDANGLTLENKKLVFDALDDFYRTAKPLSGEISGVGLFKNGAYYASIDSPDLASFRNTLLGSLSFHGITPISNHGFTPHITLAYLQPNSPLPDRVIPQLPVTFNELLLMWGDQPFGYMLDQDNLQPGEASPWVDTFDKGMDATSKEVKKKETDPGGSFTVFKDKQGAWRWVAVSSSGFQDRDGETVSTKALAQNVALHDALGNYGPLKLGPIDWWHTPAVIGDCDFSAMHGKMLVESGTFKSPVVAQRIAERIANKEFNPSISIEFTHNEPGPQPLPGRVYNQIHIVRRALLPAEVASNIASTFQVVNPASSGLITKEVKKQTMDAHKEQRLRELLGDKLTEEFLQGTERSEKAIELAGVAYKAAAALDAPMDKTPVNAAPSPAGDTKVAKKDDVLDTAPVPIEGLTEDMGNGGGEGGDFEGSPTDDAADAILEEFYNKIGQMFVDTLKDKAAEILGAIGSLGSASTKEIAAMEGIGIALKENATALTKVTGENTALKERVATLESKLAALDGTQPAAVRARASQQQGMTLNQLSPALQELVKKENQGQDPYQGDWTMQAAAQMTKSMQQRWQQ